MKHVKRGIDTPLFGPDYIADSVHHIDFSALRRDGIRYVAFDADSTLVRYRAKKLNQPTELFLKRELKQFDGVCIASNRITNDLAEIAGSLNAVVIRASWTLRKPARGFFERVISHFAARPEQIVMIGDKLVADVYGANRAGLKTVWVGKNGRDGMPDRLLQTRRVEKRMMRRYLDPDHKK